MPTTVTQIATIPSEEDTSSAINVRAAMSGQMSIPDNFKGTTVTFQTKVSDEAEESYQDLPEDEDGAPIAVVVEAGNNYPIPAVVLQGAFALKLVSDVPQDEDDECPIRIGLFTN